MFIFSVEWDFISAVFFSGSSDKCASVVNRTELTTWVKRIGRDFCYCHLFLILLHFYIFCEGQYVPEECRSYGDYQGASSCTRCLQAWFLCRRSAKNNSNNCRPKLKETKRKKKSQIFQVLPLKKMREVSNVYLRSTSTMKLCSHRPLHCLLQWKVYVTVHMCISGFHIKNRITHG